MMLGSPTVRCYRVHVPLVDSWERVDGGDKYTVLCFSHNEDVLASWRVVVQLIRFGYLGRWRGEGVTSRSFELDLWWRVYFFKPGV
jgi:hypothetical protein